MATTLFKYVFDCYNYSFEDIELSIEINDDFNAITATLNNPFGPPRALNLDIYLYNKSDGNKVDLFSGGYNTEGQLQKTITVPQSGRYAIKINEINTTKTNEQAFDILKQNINKKIDINFNLIKIKFYDEESFLAQKYGFFYKNNLTENTIYNTWVFGEKSKTGYKFKYWLEKTTGKTYQKNNGWDGTFASGLGITYDSGPTEVTLYAQYEAIPYTVKYDKNGGTGDMAAQTAYYGVDFITNPYDFKRIGYKFIGWNEKSNGSGTVWNENTKGTAENGNPWKWEYTHGITLYAQWTPCILTINYLKGSDNETSSNDPTDELVLTETFKYNAPSKPYIQTPKKYKEKTEIEDDKLWISRLGYTPVNGKEWIERDSVGSKEKTIAAGEFISDGEFSPVGNLAKALGKSIEAGDRIANLIVNWEVYGLVNIYTDNGWKKAVPYIYTGSKWERAVPYIYTGSKWTMGG